MSALVPCNANTALIGRRRVEGKAHQVDVMLSTVIRPGIGAVSMEKEQGLRTSISAQVVMGLSGISRIGWIKRSRSNFRSGARRRVGHHG